MNATPTRQSGTADTPPPASVDAAHRHAMVATAAYFRAERRGFVAGAEMQDWLDAESEVDRRLDGAASESDAARAFRVKLEAQLDDWDRRLDLLMEKTRQAKAGVRQELEEQLLTLREKRVIAQERLQDLRQRSGGAWEDLKGGAEQAWDDLRTTLDRVAARFK